VARLPAEIVAADLSSSASLARAVEGMDTAVHLAARAAFGWIHPVEDPTGW